MSHNPVKREFGLTVTGLNITLISQGHFVKHCECKSLITLEVVHKTVNAGHS